ncbi:MAG: anti-sigma factor antagonist [Clostridia bacterium]|nr:anti-sigma factor antagonist [Clostridia bacterium]
MQTVIADKSLTVFLSGEIDHHTAGRIREKADSEIIKYSPKELILDFSDVTFMDSSGVGLVIGRYKLASNNGCKTVVTGLKERDKKILMMSGLQNKIEFR